MFGTLVVGVLLLATLGTGVTSATTTYSVNMKEVGLPTGTSWTGTFNGVGSTGTGSSQVFTGLAAGSYCYYYEDPVPGAATTTRYVPYTYYGCITVPNQLTITNVYTQQVTVNFAVTPTGSGSAGPGTNWYTVGSTIAIQASETFGYTFSKWTATPTAALALTDPAWESTGLTVSATGTVTAHFNVTKSKVTFHEVGLPTGTSWSVVFGGSSTSSTSTMVATALNKPGAYSWSVPTISAAHGAVYVPSPASGGINIPYQPTQQIVFTKDFTVTTAVSPASSGSVYPYAGTYDWANNSNVPISAFDSSSYVFSAWSPSVAGSFGIQSRTTAGTNVTIMGAGVLTAKFVTGSECTTCTVTFYQVGLPAHTGWGVTFNGVQYSTTAASLTVSGQTASAGWSAFNPISAGHFDVQYVPNPYTSSGYWYVGSTASYTIVYDQEYYLTVQSNPYNSGSWTLGSAWFASGTQLPESAINSVDYAFSSWTSSGTNLTFSSATSSSVPLTLHGPATLTVNFAPLTSTVHFVEIGLPAGTTWGASIGSQGSWASTPWINITGVPNGGYGWGAANTITGGAGIQWDTVVTGGGITLPTQTFEAVVYEKAFQVSFVTAGTAGGTISPSGSVWIYSGTELPIMAENGTSATFGSWSETATTGTIGLTSTGAASTYATIKGTGTVTATFS
jgi:hypothetical protein